ncbi:MAG TPA: hypothetical protein ENI33_09685 [Thermoplasmatales archaeon]|nr:hypothetical protein [Thermoplasmatales archaeon]
MSKISEIEDFISKNEWSQPRLDMCYTTSIKFILDELSNRHNISRLKLSLRRINRLCQYRLGHGPVLEIVVDALNSVLEKIGYIADEREGKENLKLLREKIIDENASFPIVSFGPPYLADLKGEDVKYNVLGSPPWDHVIVPIGFNDKIKIFDPMEKILLKSTKINFVPNALSKPIFIHYWQTANPPYWITWIEKKTEVKEGPLDKYVEGGVRV